MTVQREREGEEEGRKNEGNGPVALRGVAGEGPQEVAHGKSGPQALLSSGG